MNINDIFTIEQYDEAYEFVSTHEYTTIEDLGNGKYQIIQLHIPTPEEIEQEEKERIANLHLTRSDVERAIYKVLGMDFIDILKRVETQHPEVDLKALKIELGANNFYRGNPYVEQVGLLLGFSSTQLDKFFETNDYHELETVEPEPTEAPTEAPKEVK